MVFVLLVFLFTIIIYKKETPTSNGVIWNGRIETSAKHSTSQISIQGFNKICFLSGTLNQQVNFYNPETNDCVMNFCIKMPDGNILWEIENIYPGYGIYEIKLNKELEKGTYSDCTFVTRCFRDDVELNGCIIKFNLYVY